MLSIVGCTGCGDTKNAAQSGSPFNADFAQTMAEADSLYNNMQFRDAYDLYLKLLDNEEARDDSVKRLNVLNSLCNLSAMTNEELFAFLSKTIKEEEMFRSSDLNRNAVMKRFSLSAARIGNAFMRGGGMGLPEFVRNCRLDYACRLMVEQPEMPFTEVGSQSGYQRTTTFYHDFRDRIGMPPAEYRKKELKKRLTSDE